MKDFYAEVYKFIKTHKKAGYSDRKIKKKMIKAGYSKKLINQVFNEYYEKNKKIPILKTRHRFRIKNKNLIIGFFVVLVLIISVLLFILMTSSCGDKQCFIDSANSCLKASYTQVENAATIKYTTDDCVLVKKVIKIDKTEPDEIIFLFKDQEMTCRYQEGNFNPNLVETFSRSIDQCEGSLKDIVLEVRSI